MAKKTTKSFWRIFKNFGTRSKIAIIIIAVILVAALVALYFYKPDLFSAIFGNQTSNTQTDDNKNDDGNTDQDAGDKLLGSLISEETVLTSIDGNLNVHFINVGQGDAIYIEFPDGKDMLIDGGRQFGTSTVTDVLDYLKLVDDDRNLTYLMVTHPDYDHFSMLTKVIEYYDVDNFYLPYANVDDWEGSTDPDKDKFADAPAKINTSSYCSFLKAAVEEPDANIFLNLDIFEIEGLSDDISFVFYALSEEEYAELPKAERNDMSPVGILEYKGYQIVFTGDAAEDATQNYLDDSPTVDCDLLKVAHHGSSTEGSNSAEFLNDVSCEYAVISCGKDNSYNHPHTELMDRLNAMDTTVYLTYETGSIVVSIDASGTAAFSFNNLALREAA